MKLSKGKVDLDLIVQKKLMQNGEIPSHIAVIMDGNGRWAKSKGFPRIAGHKSGIESVRDTVKSCAQLGVKYLTLYTFSTENWKRPKEEVSTLMKLLVKSLSSELDELLQNDIRLVAIGDLSKLPDEVMKKLNEAILRTEKNNRMTLILALSYGSRWEILEAVKKISSDVQQNKLAIDEIDVKCFSNYLTTINIPDPDLLIRTSGEFRVSNFLLWQIAYAEIFISKTLWPDFRRKDLYEAIEDFQKRERRFGKVSEQISK